MRAAVGILTARGGITSHAAPVARGRASAAWWERAEWHVDADNRTVHGNGDTSAKATG